MESDSKKLIYHPSYYFIGHFSRCIKPGAKRITCLNDCEREVYTIAYKNENGGIVLVILSNGNAIELAVTVDGNGFNVQLEAQSIMAIII